jgi:hypothetical protein
MRLPDQKRLPNQEEWKKYKQSESPETRWVLVDVGVWNGADYVTIDVFYINQHDIQMFCDWMSLWQERHSCPVRCRFS